jgi:hypothetical protein
MKRIVVLVVASALIALMLVFAGPASAQGGGCGAFGQNVATLGQTLGATFGQVASAGAPLNDTVEVEQEALCD